MPGIPNTAVILPRGISSIELAARLGNLQGRSQRELADDHPIKQIYERRCNTINRYVKRGTLDADIAKRMKKLAKDKMLRALSNVSYAKGCYESEMEQESLLREVKSKVTT